MLRGAKAKLLDAAGKLLGSPGARKLLSDDRVMTVLVGLVGARGRIRKATNAQVARIARRLRLATREEVKELRKTIEKLQDALARVETGAKDGNGAGREKAE